MGVWGLGLLLPAAETGIYRASGPPGGDPDANRQSDEVWTVHQDEGLGNGFARLGDGTRAWQIFDAGGEGSVTMTHRFAGGALEPGQYVSLELAHNERIEEGKEVGVRYLDADGQVVLEVVFVGGGGHFLYADADRKRRKTPQAYQPHTVMALAVMVVPDGGYQASFNGGTWRGRMEKPIAAVQVFNADAGPDSDLFVRQLRVGKGTPLP
jgi:hypothetical protein